MPENRKGNRNSDWNPCDIANREAPPVVQESDGMATVDLDLLTAVPMLEFCAKSLWERTTGKGFQESFPWDSDLATAREARQRRVEEASIVLQAVQTFLRSENPR
jgi:hypothetical protein